MVNSPTIVQATESESLPRVLENTTGSNFLTMPNQNLLTGKFTIFQIIDLSQNLD